MNNPNGKHAGKTESSDWPPDDKRRRRGKGSAGLPPSHPTGTPDQPATPYRADLPPRTKDEDERGEPIQTPCKVLWGNLTAPFEDSTLTNRADNAFEYGEVLAKILHGWRIKALALLLAPRDAGIVEVAAIRGAIKGVAKGLDFVSPLNVVVDMVDVFRKNRVGSAAFYQNYGMAGLGAIGGIVGGAAFEAYGFGLLASLGLSGAGLFVAAPLLMGLMGAALFQMAGAAVNQQTQAGSFLYSWYPDSFLDRVATRVWAWFCGVGDRSARGQSGVQSKSPNRAPAFSAASTGALPADAASGRRRLPPQFGPLFPPWRGGPDAPAVADGGGDDGPDSPGPAPVGGVLFANCHTVLTGIEQLTGAYWDEGTQSLVLVGKESARGEERSLALPAMDADHLKVALRAAIRGEALGVSIDAPADYRYGNGARRMPPNGTKFFVSYLGGCDKTLTGAIFFEADRIMKCLSMGMHNETRKPIEAHVPGFRSTFDMHNRSDDSGGSSWHRFWFVADHVEMIRDAATDAVTFGEVRIAVRTELELRGASAGQFNDPLDAQFAQHLTLHFDEYAREFPVFARLKELAKVSALATFLIDHGVDLDLGHILDELPADVATPETTPSLLRSDLSRTVDSVRSYAMSGGVDFGIIPSYREDVGGVASRMREYALACRTARAAEWNFSQGTALLHASAVSLGGARKLRLVETDHEFPLAGRLPRLRLQRLYESKRSEHGMFGRTWTVFLPWSLAILPASGKRHEVLDPANPAALGCQPTLALRNRKGGSTQIYRPLPKGDANAPQSWARLIARNCAAGSASFKYDPADRIYEEAGRYVLEQNGRKHHFDQSGRLVEISCNAGVVARYRWEGERLTTIENSACQAYSFIYSAESGVVEAVQSSDGRTLRYTYSPNLDLREVNLGSQRHAAYGYDLAQRLSEVSDASGRVTRRFYYRTSGDLASTRATDAIELADGGKVTRWFADDRMAALTDESGARADLAYGPKGQLHSVFIRNRGGLNWRLDYGPNGCLRRIVDAAGRATEFVCDAKGRVTRVMLPGKSALTAKRDEQGRVIGIIPQRGEAWGARFDARGVMTSFTLPAGNRIDFRYKSEMLTGFKIVGGGRNVGFPLGPMLGQLHPPGDMHPPGFNFSERPVRRLVGRHRIQCMVHQDGRSTTITGPAGSVRMSAPASATGELWLAFC